MSDFVISLIRTWVPYVVGAALAWLVTQGIVDESTSQEVSLGLSGALTALLGSVYYWLVRVLASRWPAFGYLLGVNQAPVYPLKDAA